MNKQKVASATFQCETCKSIIYTGSRTILNEELTAKYPHVKIGKIAVDHKLPVIDPINGWEGWDVYISRMFCEVDNFQVLCEACHDIKTKAESLIRKEQRKK